MIKARLIWAKNKKKLGNNKDRKKEFKQARNRYYWIIKKTKRDYWQDFL